MATRAPQPPSRLIDAVHRAASELLPGRLSSIRQGRMAAAGETPSPEPSVEPPRPLYDLGLDRIIEGSGLDAARQVGWRTLVAVASTAVAMADSDADPENPTVHALNYGPFVSGLARAGYSAARADAPEAAASASGAADLEERVLQVPGLYFVALWLHDGVDPSQDVVIPAAPAPPGLNADERYPARDLLNHLAQLARERLANDDHGAG